MDREERESFIEDIKRAIAEGPRSCCDLTIDVVRDVVRDQIDEALGEQHAAHHAAVAEFIAFWSEMKREIRSHFLKAILTFMILAFVAGTILLIRRGM